MSKVGNVYVGEFKENSDVSLLEQLCRHVESSVHEDGWNQKPMFFTFSQGEAVVGIPAVFVHQIPMPDFVYEDPARGMLKFLKVISSIIVEAGPGIEPDPALFEDGPHEGLTERDNMIIALNKLVAPGLLAFGIVCEPLQAPDDMPQEVAEILSQLGLLAKHPGVTRLRVLATAATDGRLGVIERKIDGEPSYTETRGEDRTGNALTFAVETACTMFEGFDLWRRVVLGQTSSFGGFDDLPITDEPQR
jgi:hypothetical protein